MFCPSGWHTAQMPDRYLFALLGDPVAHSRSPAIHREALRLTGLRGDYVAVRADRGILATKVAEMREGSLQGMNVTMPLKKDAWGMCEGLSPEAAGAKSVNTLRVDAGSVEGHSTDAVAFADIARDCFPSLTDVLIIGAGGAAAAALHAFEDRHCRVTARNEAKAKELADRFSVETSPWQESAGELVINATPLGAAETRLQRSALRTAAAVIDLPYGQAETATISVAKKLGIPFVDGLEFLARQAARSFQWWTGLPVDFNHLAEVARNA